MDTELADALLCTTDGLPVPGRCGGGGGVEAVDRGGGGDKDTLHTSDWS